MSILKLFYRVIRFIIGYFYKDIIVNKYISGTNKKLYFEKAQQLTFLKPGKIKYEPQIWNSIAKYVQSGSIVFDVGANIGQYSLIFSEKVGVEGKVIAIEPDSKNFAFLSFNKEINRCNNLICLNCGVNSEDTVLEFYQDSLTGGRRGSFIQSYVGENYKGYNIWVNLRKLDAIIKDYGQPCFVKIDVEGYEVKALEGLSQTLDHCTFLIEVRKETKQTVFNYFQTKGYQCFLIESSANREIAAHEDIPDFANLIFKKDKY